MEVKLGYHKNHGRKRMLNAIKKGKAAEVEFCKWLQKNLDLPYLPERNYNQSEKFSGDIIEVYNFCFEVKRREVLDLQSWWYQAIISARELNREPVVAFRQNRQIWKFLISANIIGVKTGYLQLNDIVFIEYANIAIKGHYGQNL